MLVILLSLMSCNAAPHAQRTIVSADARFHYLEFDTEAPVTSASARLEASGFALIKVPCNAGPDVYEPLRLGVVDAPAFDPRYAEWRNAELSFQRGDADAKKRYELLRKAKKLGALAALRLADLDLLAGRTQRAERGYGELKRNSTHDVETIAKATLAEIALRRGEKRAVIFPGDDESLSAEAAYRVARALVLTGQRDAAAAVLTRGPASRVVDLRNLAFARSVRADEVRERYLSHDDLGVIRMALRGGNDDLSQVRFVVLHSLFALDATGEVLEMLAPQDFAALPIAALAIDAELDEGHCDSARVHLLALGPNKRLASQLKRLTRAAACRKGDEQ